MGPKSWRTVSEDTARISIAAWEWLQNGYRPMHLADRASLVKLELALFSRLLLPYTLLKSRDEEDAVVCLGHASWAGFVWPTERLGTNGDGLAAFKMSTAGPGRFVHITSPDCWDVIPFRPDVFHIGIVLQQTGQPEPLLRAHFSQRSNLLVDDFVRLALYMGVDSQGLRSRSEWLHAVALAASQGDEDFARRAVELDSASKKDPAAMLISDPVFEATFENLAAEDKKEFPEVTEAVKRRKVRRQVHDWQERCRRKRQAEAAGAPRRKRRRWGQRAPQPPARAPAQPEPPTQPQPLVAGPQPGAQPSPPLPAQPPGAQLPPQLVPAPAAAEAAQANRPCGEPWRGEPWVEGGPFVLARGPLCWSVTCRVHRADGLRCNKSLNLGTLFSDEEAKARIKEWCVRGLSIPDAPGGKNAHMHVNPRDFEPGSVARESDLDAAAFAFAATWIPPRRSLR